MMRAAAMLIRATPKRLKLPPCCRIAAIRVNFANAGAACPDAHPRHFDLIFFERRPPRYRCRRPAPGDGSKCVTILAALLELIITVRSPPADASATLPQPPDFLSSFSFAHASFFASIFFAAADFHAFIFTMQCAQRERVRQACEQ